MVFDSESKGKEKESLLFGSRSGGLFIIIFISIIYCQISLPFNNYS